MKKILFLISIVFLFSCVNTNSQIIEDINAEKFHQLIEKGDGIISRANYLGIQYCYVGNDPKDKILYEWIEKEKIELKEVAFIGDDINDLSLINIVGFSICPNDAVKQVQDKASMILNSNGGYGCVREFSDIYLSQNS